MDDALDEEVLLEWDEDDRDEVLHASLLLLLDDDLTLITDLA